MANRITHVFKSADLRCGHVGLTAIAKKKANPKPGEHVVFINNAEDKMKVLSSNGVLSYIKSPSGKLALETINHIPAAFKATGGFNYSDALKKVITKKLEGKIANV